MNLATRSITAAALFAVAAVGVTACSSGSSGGSSAGATSTVTGDAAPLYSSLPADITSKDKIVLGSSIDYPPFEYYAKDGKTLQGYETELMAKVADQLGVPFDWQNASFDTLFTGLDAKRYDIVFGAVNDNAEREQKYDFVDYAISSQSFDVAAGNPKNIKTEDDLCGKKIAAVTGGVQIDYLNAQSKTCVSDGKSKITVLGFDGNSGEQTAVRSGQADALLEGYATAVAFADGSNGKLELVPDLQVAKSYYGVVVPKASTKLRDAIEKAWANVMKSGDYDAILKKAGFGEIGLDAPIVNGATTDPQD